MFPRRESRPARVRRMALVGAAVSLLALGVGLALADTSGTTVTVTPNTNLTPSGQTVSVSGSGFAPGQSGTIRQAMVVDPYEEMSQAFATFTADNNGAFGPVSFGVSETFTTTGSQQLTCSTSQPCTVLAFSNNSPQNARSPISFGTPPPPTTTTSTTAVVNICDRLAAQLAATNAQIDAIIRALPTNLTSEQRAALIAQMDAIRRQVIAQFSAALASANCG
jgi:hypothetical protein